MRENSTGEGTRCFPGQKRGGREGGQCGSGSLNICKEEMSCITVMGDKETLESGKYERQDREEW